MELKYCECCGVLLGYVRSDKKYCSECASKKKDLDRKHGVLSPWPKEVPCKLCGKPLLAKSSNYKYHHDCAKIANKTRMRELKAKYREEEKEQEKHKPKKKVLSVSEVQALADKLGMSYAKVSWKLSTGELDYER